MPIKEFNEIINGIEVKYTRRENGSWWFRYPNSGGFAGGTCGRASYDGKITSFDGLGNLRSFARDAIEVDPLLKNTKPEREK